MPIEESYKRASLEKLQKVEEYIKNALQEILSQVDEEDLEYGVSQEATLSGLGELWEEAVEKNNYMEVVFTEIMEHHDGAYLKATFRNSTEDAYAERYISVWSSGRVEMSYALFLSLNSVSARVERIKGDTFRFFFKK
ncbi:MAG: hypothetical protein NZ527_01995 [Hydrogenobacter thermophilus]|uniref:hypothetical protein n=1 Tax=Hydrogenobacter thermophilus TaxID=940 RepID=UPI000CBCC844|nr:hypothetical protein [Hydrogenobacter thermophilus]MCS7284465.1 hypothetical protein [Hydrogenobacter thermophilus]QWK19917.1 MAG: hypothetical protein KNN13_00865 [Hydrogenobacter thermophilus]GBC88890.1 hypothetical protein HRbin13_01022 [bacterium HR13]